MKRNFPRHECKEKREVLVPNPAAHGPARKPSPAPCTDGFWRSQILGGIGLIAGAGMHVADFEANGLELWHRRGRRCHPPARTPVPPVSGFAAKNDRCTPAPRSHIEGARAPFALPSLLHFASLAGRFGPRGFAHRRLFLQCDEIAGTNLEFPAKRLRIGVKVA